MRIFAFTILALLITAAPAAAGTVHLEFRGDVRYDNRVHVVFKAAPGERNQVTAEQVGTTFTIRDAGAPITADSRCTAVEGGVTCPGNLLELHLGDQDDVATVNGTVFGGAGNDRLSGTGKLNGGPGEDVLEGPGPFADDDGDTPAHDVYRGTGKTKVSYGKRRTGIRVDLRKGRAAEDTVSGIPNVEGGYGDDVLIGDDGPNELSGSRGGDRMVGLGGDDDLNAGLCCSYSYGREAETIEGGAGDDDLFLAGGRSTVRCGPGRDQSYGATLPPFVAADCETVEIDTKKGRLAAELRSAGASVFTLTRCGCRRHSFRVTHEGLLVARASGREGTVRLRLNALGRRLLQANGRLDVTITTREGDDTERFRTRLRLRR